MVKSFRDLIIWERANKVTHKVYDLTDTFPRRYSFNLGDQLKRSALSIPTNIAEGSSSAYSKELMQFLNIAKRSLGETRYLLLFANERKLIENTEYKSLDTEYEEIHKMINSLVRSLKRRIL